jgi:hypothetical protein
MERSVALGALRSNRTVPPLRVALAWQGGGGDGGGEGGSGLAEALAKLILEMTEPQPEARPPIEVVGVQLRQLLHTSPPCSPARRRADSGGANHPDCGERESNVSSQGSYPARKCDQRSHHAGDAGAEIGTSCPTIEQLQLELLAAHRTIAQQQRTISSLQAQLNQHASDSVLGKAQQAQGVRLEDLTAAANLSATGIQEDE